MVERTTRLVQPEALRREPTLDRSSQMAEGAAAHLLEDFTIITDGSAELPVRVCAQHLAMLGARWERRQASQQSEGLHRHLAGKLSLRRRFNRHDRPRVDDGDGPTSVDCSIRWQNPRPKPLSRDTDEVMVQALSGLMAVHGRDQHIPRRLGLDVASVAAGILATQGVLAVLIAQQRGHPVSNVETSTLQAALWFLGHHLAIATCNDEFPFEVVDMAPGPPFCTADGEWFELEALRVESWLAFWRNLGVEPIEAAGRAWLPFVFRYLRGSCTLPAILHEVTQRHTLAEVRHFAEASGIVICRVRRYVELLADLGWSAGSPLPAPPWSIIPGMWQMEPHASHIPSLAAPLAGIKVVEVTSRMQGPLAGLLLQMLGAHVVKVEPPGGDMGRNAPPLAGSWGAAYLAYNRDKEVVEIDYKKPTGKEQLANLIARADIFLHNWPTGRAEKLGLTYEAMAHCNPGLVYAHASAWGSNGAAPAPIAGDYLVQAYAACGEGLNPAHEAPFPSRVTLVDVTGGLLACEGALAGLYLRERTRRGCYVETSLLAGAMALQQERLTAIANLESVGRHAEKPRWRLLNQPLGTADGFLVVTVEDRQSLKRLAGLCGLDMQVEASESQIEKGIAAQLSIRPGAEWEALLGKAGIAAASVCLDLAAIAHDPRIAPLLDEIESACWAPSAPWHIS